MTDYLNRVYHMTDAVGQTTTITLSDAAFNSAFVTMEEAGAIDGGLYSYVIEEGSDFEIQQNQTYDATAKTLTRGTPVLSKIAGSAGTDKMSLLGTAAVRVTPVAEDYRNLENNAVAMAIALG